MTIVQIEKGIRQLDIKDQLQLLSWFMQYIRQQVLSLLPAAGKDEKSVSQHAMYESSDIDDDPFLSFVNEQDGFSSDAANVHEWVSHTTVEAADNAQPQFLDNDPLIGMFSGPATLSQDVKKIVQQGLVEGSGLTWKE